MAKNTYEIKAVHNEVIHPHVTLLRKEFPRTVSATSTGEAIQHAYGFLKKVANFKPQTLDAAQSQGTTQSTTLSVLSKCATICSKWPIAAG